MAKGEQTKAEKEAEDYETYKLLRDLPDISAEERDTYDALCDEYRERMLQRGQYDKL